MISKMKTQQFEKVTDEIWKETAIKSLRGLPFEKLITSTIEKIDIQPLYTKETIEQQLGDRQSQMVNTIRAGKNATHADWIIAQQVYTTESSQFVAETKEAIAKGNEAIVYDGNFAIDWSDDDLKQLAVLAETYPIYAFNVRKDDSFTAIYSFIPESKRKGIRGAYSGEGKLPEGFHLIRSASADTIQAHLDGADMITELALTLAQAADASTNYTSFRQFENQFFVRFAIDTHFFLEIAKLRAFRVLWQNFARAYGYEKQSHVPIFSETSLRTFSKLDSYVNLLRAGNEAFSAVLGGTDVLTVHPHNVISEITPAGIRHARNIQLVIKEETFVNHIVDPAGGSYFIDTLTDEMVEKAWQQFLEIEEAGGYRAYVASGALEAKLNQLYQKRLNELSTREASLIGTNIYADLSEAVETGRETVQVKNRLASIYEELRLTFAKKQPHIVLLTFGELKDFKARADFVSGYFATAGMKTEMSPTFKSVEEGKAWIQENAFDYGIICTHPRETEKIMEEFIRDFPLDKWIDVAGKYDSDIAEKWQQAGISGYIYQGQNQLEKFAAIKQRWEGDAQHAEA